MRLSGFGTVGGIRSGIALFLLLLAGTVLPGCNNSRTALSPLPGTVTLAASKSDIGAMVWIAREKGFFEETGLTIAFQSHSSGKSAMDALLTGQADLATCAEFVLVKHSFQEPDLRILASTATANIISVYGRRDKGISSPADLKGKRVGVTMGSAAEYFLGRFLTAQKMDFEDITTVDLSPPRLIEGTVSGKLDAVVVWQPYGHMLRKSLGEGLVVFPAQEGQHYYFILVSRTPWLAGHHEHAERIMTALGRTEKWMKDHPEETKSLVSSLFDADADYVDNVWDPQMPHLNCPQGLLLVMDAEKRWSIKKGLVSGDREIDYTDFLWLAPLEKVKPASVTIIR